jgi:hypothetical protein
MVTLIWQWLPKKIYYVIIFTKNLREKNTNRVYDHCKHLQQQTITQPKNVK